MKLRERFGVFVLTRQEQRTIAFIVLALAVGLWTKHYRHTHTRPSGLPNDPPAATAPASPSVSAATSPPTTR
jgi:hypothetical protein